jgi:hypothetical protein
MESTPEVLEPRVYVGPPTYVESMNPLPLNSWDRIIACKHKKYLRCIENSEIVEERCVYNYGRWTDVEKELFKAGLAILGPQWSQIAKEYVKTRTAVQVTCYGCASLRKTKQMNPSC